MIKLRYAAYNQLPIIVYKQVMDILDEDITPIEKDLEIIALLADVDVNDIYKLKATDVNILQHNIQFLGNPIIKNRKYKKIDINGNRYNVHSNLDELTMGQYIDFQMMWKNDNYLNHLSDILSIFIIPEGKTYNEGYDLIKVREEIENNLDIETATSIAFFLHKKLISLIKDKVQYCRLMIWWMKITMKDKELKKKMKELMNLYKKMENYLTDGYHSLMKSVN